MQIAPSFSLAPADSTKSDRDLATQLEKSEIYRDYQKAFEATTGFPLDIRGVGSFQTPLQGSRRINAFCALMAGRNKSCSACLQLQQRIESEAQAGAATMDCFAGLTDSAVPIRVGNRVVAFLQTGQVLRQKPTAAQFSRTVRQLGDWGTAAEVKALQAAYFETRVVAKSQYESVLRLLEIFAQHLSALSNQLMVRESAAEAPAISRARAFIAERQGDELSLLQVSQAVNMSSFYFCKIFKKATGLTFTEYLARTRIETVKHLLLNPHKRVSEAAYEAGFQSLSQFNRVFRRIVGEAPTDYRDSLHASSGSALGSARMACAV